MELVSKKIKKHNFSAGPAILPETVIEQAAAAARDYNGTGLSILEVSHRGPEFIPIMEEAFSLVRELLNLSDDYEVMFLSGGASSQFFMLAMNLLPQDGKAGYLNTGTWSTKAIKEARNFGNVLELDSSKDQNFNYIPKGYSIDEDLAYLHLTSNNTIVGTQHHVWPETSVPFVCDMSSDIFSRPLDISKFGMIYAGAQKNMGPAGTTLVIVRKDMLGKVKRNIPSMLDYNIHIKNDSSFNTPPVFPIYVCMLTMRWLKANGGLKAMEERNKLKAALLYKEIDENPLFEGTAKSEDRSLMNVTFVMKNPDLESAFMKACTEVGCVGIKGHRSVGGFRASIYNALPIESVQVLVDVMKKFAATHS
jgi:phosphoserine aminotransferase